MLSSSHAVLVLVLVLVLWALVHAGPQTNFHPDMTDQELFWGADQYDFAVVLRAEGMECFWHFAHHGETFYLNFMVRRNEQMLTRLTTFINVFGFKYVYLSQC